MERNINALLEAANYVRFETLINGNQAAELDNLINSVAVAMDQVEDRKGKTTGRLSAMLMAKAEERLNAATEALYTWLKEFKANRPNVAINIDQEEPATEASKEDYSHAANCLDTYLNNDSFIYENHTQKAIEAIVNEEMAIDSPVVSGHIRNAINRAKWEVEKYDHLTPTTHDIETVKANYVAYIIECAQYEAKQAI